MENVCKFNPLRASDVCCVNFVLERSEGRARLQEAENHFMILVTEGKGSFLRDGDEREVKRGDMLFVVKGERFAIRCIELFEYMYVDFYGRRADELLLRMKITEGGVVEGMEKLIPFWQECHARAQRGNIDLLCEAVLLYSLAELPIPDEVGRGGIHNEMATLAAKHFTDPDFSLSTLAERMGYSSKHLSSAFKSKRGIGFSEHLRNLRVKHAVFLIEEGIVSVKSVALLSGYRDPLYFSKVFAAEMGVSPKAYIKAVEERERGESTKDEKQ